MIKQDDTPKTLAYSGRLHRNPDPDRCCYSVKMAHTFADYAQCSRKGSQVVYGHPFCQQHAAKIRAWLQGNGYDPDQTGPYLVPAAEAQPDGQPKTATKTGVLGGWFAINQSASYERHKAYLGKWLALTVTKRAGAWDCTMTAGASKIWQGLGHPTAEAAAQAGIDMAEELLAEALADIKALNRENLPH